MTRFRLWWALAATVAGTAILAAWFGSYWPGSGWTLLSRTELADKGRQVASHFGLNTRDWSASEVPSVLKPLAHYGHGVSALTVRVTYRSPQSGQWAQAGFDSAGLPLYWQAPEGFKQARKFDSDQDAAQEAFQFMAGAEAAGYKSAGRSAGDGRHEENYEWKKNMAADSGLRDRITILTQDGIVKRAERTRYLASNDDDSDDNYGRGYWDIFAGVFGLICVLGIVIAIGIYTLWLARKAINHQFPLRMALAALLFMAAGMFGIYWDKMRAVSPEFGLPIFPALLLAALVSCFVAVGRGISGKTQDKWMSLEQLCRLAPISKSTGESLGAGVLVGPLLTAIPFLIAACKLFPGSWVLPNNMEVLYSRSPMLDSLNMPAQVCLLGFFGFGIPAMQRLIRFRWLRWLMIPPVGVMFFADQTRLVSGPWTAPLAAGFLTLSVLWFLWAQFDVLAILTAQLTGGLLLSLLMMAQNGHLGWSLGCALGSLVLAAELCYQFGRIVSAGDARASLPTLSGFQAEREKLRAEFSLARRAQEDMLPDKPPTIPGYSIAASCTPSLEVGGDLYDFLKLPDGRIGIGVADVSGKGVPAALYMTLTKGLLASITKNSSELGPVVEEVNRHLHSVTRKKVFVTMALGFLDAERRILQCVRAGHNPVVWRQTSKASTTLVSPTGLGLGITASRVFSTQLKVVEMELSDGDSVVFYSDGITEAMNSGLEQFGEQRLMEAVEKTDHLDATAARDSILNEVKEFLDGVHPQDDMTLVVLRVGA